MDKVVLITGGSEGLGAAIATSMAATNCSIWILARNEEKLKEQCLKIKNSGFKCNYLVCDLRDEQMIHHAVQEIINTEGRIDTLINNAAVWNQDEIVDIPLSKITQVFSVNVVGLICITGKVLPHMLSQKEGVIINILSTSALEADPEWPVYVSTKFAVNGFSQSIRKKYASFGIKILDIFPAGINTRFYLNAGIPVDEHQSWMIQKEEVAKVVAFTANTTNISLEQVVIKK